MEIKNLLSNQNQELKNIEVVVKAKNTEECDPNHTENKKDIYKVLDILDKDISQALSKGKTTIKNKENLKNNVQKSNTQTNNFIHKNNSMKNIKRIQTMKFDKKQNKLKHLKEQN